MIANKPRVVMCVAKATALIVAIPLIISNFGGAKPQGDTPQVSPAITCDHPLAKDQDDMCLWIHPRDTSRSAVVTSDKDAGQVFVYDLAGTPLQAVSVPKPGSIDVRYGFGHRGGQVDLVAVNQREAGFRLILFAMDPITRQLHRLDDGSLLTAENYGGALYKSANTGKFYFFTTSKASGCRQYELQSTADALRLIEVRQWKLGQCEGAVADDAAGVLYIAEENTGIWKVGAEPHDPAPGTLIVKHLENGLVDDIEGLALYHAPSGKGYLIASNQGGSDFHVYEKDGKHVFLGRFSVRGAQSTDGLDCTNVPLSPQFPRGLFACHTDVGNCPVLLTPWPAIAESMQPPLVVDTSWRPRQ